MMTSSRLEKLPKISPFFTESVCNQIISEIKTGIKEIQITSVIPLSETKKGDSYLSNICRFTINATGRINGILESVEIHVIVKYLLENIGRRKTFRSPDFFENEAIFYREVWPALHDFQKSKQINSYFENIPRLLSAHIDGANDYIALQNLNFEGYRTCLRGNGLDYNHTLLVLKLFANFHGLSLAFKDQHPEQFHQVAAKLKETYFHINFRTWYEKFQQSLIIITKDAVKRELPERYLDKLNDLLDNGDFYEKICDLCKDQGKFSVITHGDAWIPNFLIKYEDNGSPKEAILIDFQLARYASLSNDLLFFLYSCVQYNLLVDCWDEFIAFYHTSLTDSLEKYGSARDLISIQDLQKDIKKSIVFGIGMSMEALTMSLLDDEDVNDLDAIQGDAAVPLEKVWVVKPFNDQMKRKRIALIIQHAVDNQFI